MEKKQTAKEALDAHATAKVAYVNKDGEWHFSTPPADFEVVETIYKEGTKTKLVEIPEGGDKKGKKK